MGWMQNIYPGDIWEGKSAFRVIGLLLLKLIFESALGKKYYTSLLVFSRWEEIADNKLQWKIIFKELSTKQKFWLMK